MRFGLSPADVSLVAAQALVTAQALFMQTGDPLDRLVLVQNADGTWATQTVRNQQLLAQAGVNNTMATIGIGTAAAVLAVGVGLYFLLKK